MMTTAHGTIELQARMGYSGESPHFLGIAIAPHVGLFVAKGLVGSLGISSNHRLLGGGQSGSDRGFVGTKLESITVLQLNIPDDGYLDDSDWDLPREVCAAIVETRGRKDRELLEAAIGSLANQIKLRIELEDGYYVGRPAAYFSDRADQINVE